MRKKYGLTFIFDAIILDEPPAGSVKDNPNHQKAWKFIIEFAKNKEALRTFFLTHCIEKYFHELKIDNKKEFDKIAKKVGHTEDIGSLFVSAANEFSEDVKEELRPFIEWVYKDLPKSDPKASIQDDLKFFIEHNFSSMIIESAEFSEVKDQSA